MLRANRCLSLLLGFMVAIAPAVLAVPATAMTLQMSMSGDAGSGDCCPGAKADGAACPMICANALSHATMPAPVSLVFQAFGKELWRSAFLPLPDHPRPPDPPPPKSATLR